MNELNDLTERVTVRLGKTRNWHEVRGYTDQYRLYVRGYAFIHGGFYGGLALSNYLKALIRTYTYNQDSAFSKLESVIPTLNGCWALVYQSKEGTLIAVDRMRSIPLFYADDSKIFCISDDANNVIETMRLSRINDLASVEFLSSHYGFISGRETLYKGLFQVLPGEIVKIDYYDQKSEITNHQYYRFVPCASQEQDLSEEELETQLSQTLYRVFERFAKALTSYTPIVPLSGGLDSRLLSAMLKIHGYTNTQCFSYGDRHNQESRSSYEVAKSLNLSWTFVDYDYSSWYKWFREESTQDFIEFASNKSSLFNIMDWPATNAVLGKLPASDCPLFLPGHSFDFLAGGHMTSQLYENDGELQPKDVSDIVLRSQFDIRTWLDNNSRLKNIIRERIESQLPSYAHHASWRASGAYDNWNFEHRQAKFIINCVRTYDYLGANWMLPWWDYELMDFFTNIKPEYRFQKRLYVNTLMNKIFVGNLSELAAIPVVKTRPRSQVVKILEGIVPWRILCRLANILEDDLHFRYGQFVHESISSRLFTTVRQAIPLDDHQMPANLRSILLPRLDNPAVSIGPMRLSSIFYLVKLLSGEK